MTPLPDILADALERLSPGPLHARAGFWLHQMGHPIPLADWIEESTGLGKATLLSLAARIHGAPEHLSAAAQLAEGEWLSPERAWSAIGSARLALGDVPGAQAALTHPDVPPAPLTLPALSWLIQHRLADGGDPRPVLDHLGPGHDAAAALRAVVLRAPHLAHAALPLVPPAQRDEVVLSLFLDGCIPERLPPVGSTIAAIHAALLGHTAAARAALAPLLVAHLPTWQASAPAQAAPIYHHLALACAALADTEGALWCLERLGGCRPRLRGAGLVAVLCPDERLVSWALAQGSDDADQVEALCQAGRIAARLQQPQRAHDLLRSAAVRAGHLADFYTRRLALQVISHAQIEAGAPLEALSTIDGIDRHRFGDVQRTAAAAALLFSGKSKPAMKVIRSFPTGRRRTESCCAISAAMFPACLGPGV
ncbi:MAG: hypothetical protein P8R54_01095 [Myxococcota bacterium]|nr:hypothetical protein [Myxococcota bacterium]